MKNELKANDNTIMETIIYLCKKRRLCAVSGLVEPAICACSEEYVPKNEKR